MQSVKLTSMLRLFTSPLFKENFSDMEHRYSEICTDELNRQVLQIDFTTSFPHPMFGADLAELGIAITDFLNDKNHPAIFGSCSYNGINRVYFRAYVTHKRYVSDPETTYKQKKRGSLKRTAKNETQQKPPTSEESQPSLPPLADETQIVQKREVPAYIDIVNKSKKPGDRHGIGFVPSTLKEEQVVTAPPPPVVLPSADPELKTKFDKLTLKSFALEQEVVNLKSSIVDKDLEIKKLVTDSAPPVQLIKFDDIDATVRNTVRRVVKNNRPPIFSERAFVQHNVGRTALEIVLDTYYTCEFYGLRDDALDSMQHLVENIVFPDLAEESARLCFSLIMPHIKFLMRRESEMEHRGRK